MNGQPGTPGTPGGGAPGKDGAPGWKKDGSNGAPGDKGDKGDKKRAAGTMVLVMEIRLPPGGFRPPQQRRERQHPVVMLLAALGPRRQGRLPVRGSDREEAGHEGGKGGGRRRWQRQVTLNEKGRGVTRPFAIALSCGAEPIPVLPTPSSDEAVRSFHACCRVGGAHTN